MKKALIVLAAAAGSIFAAGCQKDALSQKTGGYMDGVVSDIKAQAADELKKMFAAEIEDFFKSGDLTAALGISSDEQKKLEASIKKYIDDYGTDEEKLSEAKESLENLFENADGLTAEELKSKIEGILGAN